MGWIRAASRFGLALLGEPAALCFIDEGPRLRYQHLRIGGGPSGDLVACGGIAVQLAAVVDDLRRTVPSLSTASGVAPLGRPRRPVSRQRDHAALLRFGLSSARPEDKHFDEVSVRRLERLRAWRPRVMTSDRIRRTAPAARLIDRTTAGTTGAGR